MTTLLTPIDIVNAACSAIGEEPLQSFDDDSPIAQAALLAYDDIVDFNLSLTPFSWAKTIQPLSRLASPPLTDFKFVYDLPAGMSGPPLRVMDSLRNADRPFTAYALVNGQVHADAEALWAEIRFRPSPHLWPAAFKSATISAIAARLAMAFASDDKFKAIHDQEAYGTPSENFRGGKMRAAIYDDARATPPKALAAHLNPLDRTRVSPSYPDGRRNVDIS